MRDETVLVEMIWVKIVRFEMMQIKIIWFENNACRNGVAVWVEMMQVLRVSSRVNTVIERLGMMDSDMGQMRQREPVQDFIKFT